MMLLAATAFVTGLLFAWVWQYRSPVRPVTYGLFAGWVLLALVILVMLVSGLVEAL